MDFAFASLIAVSLAAVLVGVCAVTGRLSKRRDFREMAGLTCPGCLRPIGIAAVRAGRDCSPWEELRVAPGGGLVHSHPGCRSVKCPACGHSFVIRLNRQGERFGRRLSVDDD